MKVFQRLLYPQDIFIFLFFLFFLFLLFHLVQALFFGKVFGEGEHETENGAVS